MQCSLVYHSDYFCEPNLFRPRLLEIKTRLECLQVADTILDAVLPSGECT